MNDLEKQLRLIVKNQVNLPFQGAVNQTVEKLAASSPKGATEELSQGWRWRFDAFPNDDNAILEAEIYNVADASYFRAFGRGAGKAPPVDNLQAWVAAKGMATNPVTQRAIAFAISKKIAREGTNRYQTKIPQPELRDEQLTEELVDAFLSELNKYNP